MYILKSSASPQKPKPKENHSLSHQNKTTRKQIQGLNLETGREKKTIHYTKRKVYSNVFRFVTRIN